MALPHKLFKPNKAMPNKLLSHEATKLSLHMHIYTLNDEKAIKRGITPNKNSIQVTICASNWL